jgi:hypothetical protein
MHKDLEKRLKETAQEIINMNGQSDYDDLMEKVLHIYNDLNILSYLKKNPVAVPPVVEKEGSESNNTEQKINSTPEKKIPEEIFVPKFDSVKEDMSQKKEFQDTVTIEETAKLFESRKPEGKQLSLHDKLLSSTIQVGLNDRIAFVNKLFNYSQSEFNKTLNVLNACKTKQEAFHYIQTKVKPGYNWAGKEDLEERFLALIERKFL